MHLQTELHKNLISFYEIPVAFWRPVLGHNLHFHLGHFLNPNVSLENAMRLAVQRLAMQISTAPVRRVLDVGCGWGGPAIELTKLWEAEVYGLTISRQQRDFVNKQAISYSVPVQAKVVDVESYDFGDAGTFDVLWLHEILEHVIDRQALFLKLHYASHANTNLAITMNCRAHHIPKEALYNEFMGIQPLQSLPELAEMLDETGWEVLTTQDCTPLTESTWRYWVENLNQIAEPQYREQADKLKDALINTRELYRRGMLQSVQLVAKKHC